MMMSPRTRKFALAVHLSFSVGWIGAIVAFLPLAVIGLTSQDVRLVRGVYLTMELSVRFAIVPLAFGSLLTGVIQSLGTPWGLFRHYWTVFSLGLTILATIVLLEQSTMFRSLATRGADTLVPDAELLGMRSPRPLIHALGGLVVLLVIHVLNIYKPRGLTPWGRRKLEKAPEGDA